MKIELLPTDLPIFKGLPLILFLLFGTGLFQQAYAQVERWTGFAVEYEANANWAFETEIEHRRRWSEAGAGEYLFLLGANRAIHERLDLSAGLRYDLENQRNDEIRVFADLNAGLPVISDELELKIRTRYQQERGLGKDPTGLESALRQRYGIDWRVNEQWNAVLEYEWRYRFDRDEFVRDRFTLAIGWALSPTLNLEAFYRIDKDIREASPKFNEITGLFLSYHIPHRNETDWEERRPFDRHLIW